MSKKKKSASTKEKPLSYRDKKKLLPPVSKPGREVKTFSASSNIGRKKSPFPKDSKVGELPAPQGVTISLHNIDGLDMSPLLKLMDRPLLKSDVYAQELRQLLGQLSAVSGVEAICNMLISIFPEDKITKKDRQLALRTGKAVDLIIKVIEEKFSPIPR